MRLRALAGRPLDPALGRSAVILAGVVCVGFGALVALGLIARNPGEGKESVSAHPPAAGASVPAQPSAPYREVRSRRHHRPTQDPQDRPGSPAAGRARHELATHRALQHLPYRRRGLSIRLIGARGAKAILAVRASTLAEAHRGWRAFLRRFEDPGGAYLPRFRARGGRR